MLNTYTSMQTVIDSYISSLTSTLYCVSVFFKSCVAYIQVDFIQEIKHTKWLAKLTYRWSHPARLYSMYNYHILDQSAFIWLWYNADIREILFWNVYNLFIQMQQELLFFIQKPGLSFKLLYSTWFTSLNILLFFKFIKYLIIGILFLNLFFYIRTSLKNTLWTNNIVASKFFIFFETEEELGSLDDSLLFIMFFILLLSWYFLSTLLFLNTNISSISFLLFGLLLLLFFVLLIPYTVLLNFGVTFTSYVRGAAPSTNSVVETLFDLIGILVVFTRFIVQNIRFVLIFAAYFELYEWVYNSPYITFFHTFFSFSFDSISNLQPISFSLFFYYASVIFSGLIFYAYYFVHLLLLLFIQLGAYFLISFWLFFFFYTSFVLTKSEKFFFFKKYIN